MAIEVIRAGDRRAKLIRDEEENGFVESHRGAGRIALRSRKRLENCETKGRFIAALFLRLRVALRIATRTIYIGA